MHSEIAFVSSGKVGLISADGTNERFLQFDVPDQLDWSIGPAFPDGEHFIVHSLDEAEMSKLVYGQAKRRLWLCNWKSGTLARELVASGRPADFIGCYGILPDGQRLVLDVTINKDIQLFIADLDGTDWKPLTADFPGFHYGDHLSPDGSQIAFHVTSSQTRQAIRNPFCPNVYSINVVQTDGSNRTLVAGDPGHLYFGPRWSPDGRWLAYMDCGNYKEDPSHFRGNICIGRPDGSEHLVITEGLPHWFAATYGTVGYRRRGANFLQWSPNGRYIAYSRLLPGSRPDFEFDTNLPNHEESIFKPENARGGSQICLLDPFSGETIALTEAKEHLWTAHPKFSADGSQLLFLRCQVNEPPEIWIMNADGSNQARLTRGFDDTGADFPMWLN